MCSCPPVIESVQAAAAQGSRLLATEKNAICYLYDTRWCIGSRRVPTAHSSAHHGHSGSAGSSSSGGGGGGGSRSGDEASVFQFSGHTVDSYYVRTSFSPDGRFFASASSDGGIYIWEADRPELPPIVLWGHAYEVTAIAWSAVDFGVLSTASDVRRSRRLPNDEFARATELPASP